MRVLTMSRISTLFAAWLLIILSHTIAGCDLFGLDDERVSVQLQTDQRTYALPSTIVLEVSNRSSAPVYRAGCPVINLQELHDGKLITEWMVSGFQFCGGRAPIEPNRSYERTVNLSSELLQTRLSTARFNESVDYRLDFVSLYHSRESDDRLGEANRQSNRFKITHP